MLEISFFIYVIGIMTFLKNRYHIITVLLRFEFIYLRLFVIIIFILLSNNYVVIMIYLIIIVAEASLGLRLLVIINFFYGNDKVISMFILKC